MSSQFTKFVIILIIIVLFIAGIEVFYVSKVSMIGGPYISRAQYSASDIVSDVTRGYAGPPGISIKAKRIQKGDVKYDVTYTSKEFGLRVVPHDIAARNFNPDFKNIAFFGCSFTYYEEHA